MKKNIVILVVVCFCLISCRILDNDENVIKKNVYLTEENPKNIVLMKIPLFEDEKINNLVEKHLRDYFSKNHDIDLDLVQLQDDIPYIDQSDYIGCLIDIDYVISYNSKEFVSIVFKGMFNEKKSAHPTNVLTALNIDLEDYSNVLLSDRYNISQEMYNIFADLSIKTITEQVADGVYPIEWETFSEEFCSWEEFNDGIKNESICTYYTESGVVVSYTVPHALGDYFETKIPYNLFLEFEKTNR